MTYQHPSDAPPPDRDKVGRGTLEVFGELSVWLLICGAAALGMSLLKRWPVVTVAALVVLAIALFALLASRAARRRKD